MAEENKQQLWERWRRAVTAFESYADKYTNEEEMAKPQFGKLLHEAVEAYEAWVAYREREKKPDSEAKK
ncbi:MAG: hypothetical protein ABSD63_09320 [Candidatus Korobacteraceae bacterium]|jgi:hypothetical protein